MVAVSVRDFGAVGNGKSDDTNAFIAAISWVDKRHRAGQLGGEDVDARIVFPGPSSSNLARKRPRHQDEWTYLIRPLNLTSHLTLHIEAGARIVGIADRNAWPVIPPLPSYGRGRDYPGPRYTSLLHGENLTGVTIVGDSSTLSVIDGNGNYWWNLHRNRNLKYTRGHLVEFMYSSNIWIYNVRLRDSPFWTTHFYDCDNVHVRNVAITAPTSAPNTDGFDPDSSRNVVIEDSTYVGGDDCVAIKSGWDCFGIEYGKPASDIVVRNVSCEGPFAGVAIGSEMSGGVENVLVENVRFPGKVNKPVDVKTGRSRGGFIRNVTYRGLLVMGSMQRGIHIDAVHYSDSPNPSCPPDWLPPDGPPLLSDFFLLDINGENATYSKDFRYSNCAVHIYGDEERWIENVILQNVRFPIPPCQDVACRIENDPYASFGTCCPAGTSWNCSNVRGEALDNGLTIPWPPCALLAPDKIGQVKGM
jgi:polygalacturonase